MLFSSTVFLFIFLPLVLLIHFVLPREQKNIFLLIASLFFYSWGEHEYVLIMIGSILFNYLISTLYNKTNKGLIIAMGIILNVLLLLHFKYFNFLFSSIQDFGFFLDYRAKEIHLPIGISFFTFQSISYLMDIRKEKAMIQDNLLDLGLYISLFPQLIAGPIIRYKDVYEQINVRTLNSQKTFEGINRFTRGLAKKVLLANPMGYIADEIFLSQTDTMPAPLAWLGIIAYTFQIYFDFSGYSDMAIGIGKMLGFDFLENFNYPYISKSIKEFWRRWHISLSSWFRDYLYIPLGGNRNGTVSMYKNLIIVFLVTGFWHGANWTFIVWGIYHGFFLICERIFLAKFLTKIPRVLQHIYCILVVMIGWVFFKAETLGGAIEYLGSMFCLTEGSDYKNLMLLTPYAIFILLSCLLFSTPIRILFNRIVTDPLTKKSRTLVFITHSIFILSLFSLSLFEVASSSYNPFIYFRF